VKMRFAKPRLTPGLLRFAYRLVDADMEAIELKAPGEGKAILAKHGLNTIDRALLSTTFGSRE